MMTVRERAQAVAKEFGNGPYDWPVAAIEEALLDYGREMRERCAKVVLGNEERDDFPWCGDVRELAVAIRSLPENP